MKTKRRDNGVREIERCDFLIIINILRNQLQ